MQLYNHRSPQLLQTSIQHQTPACIQLPCKASTFLWFTSYSHPCPAHILRAFHQRIFQDGTFPQDFSATLHKQTFTQKSTLFDAFIHNLASTLLVHFFTRALPLTYFCALSIHRLFHTLCPFDAPHPLFTHTLFTHISTCWRLFEGRYTPWNFFLRNFALFEGRMKDAMPPYINQCWSMPKAFWCV